MKTETLNTIEREETLIRLAKNGDFAAFEALLRAYRPLLYRQALRKLKNCDDAHDAVQDAALKAFKALGSFDASRPVLPWLQRICSNCCIDLMRGRKHVCESIDDHAYNMSDPHQNVESEAECAMLHQQIANALVRMPVRYKRIVQMRHFDHMDVNEIAQMLNKPEGTIKSWLFRAREMLRKELDLTQAHA